jgi:P27 family predicted phage terminase small subunit
MTKGRGKNAPDRSDEMTAQGVTIVDAVALQPMTELPEDAQTMWDSIAGNDIALKILRPEDTPLLEQYCMAYQVWVDAKRSYAATSGMKTREYTPNGSKRNVDIDVMAKASDQMLKIAKQIGLTPVARAQMSLTNTATASLVAANFPDRIMQMYEAANGKTPKRS